MPEELVKISNESQSTQDLENLNNFLGQSLNDNFTDVAALSSEIVDSNINEYTACQPMECSNEQEVGCSKQYTMLQSIQGTDVDNLPTEDLYHIPENLPICLRVKLAYCLIKCSQCSAIKVRY